MSISKILIHNVFRRMCKFQTLSNFLLFLFGLIFFGTSDYDMSEPTLGVPSLVAQARKGKGNQMAVFPPFTPAFLLLIFVMWPQSTSIITHVATKTKHIKQRVNHTTPRLLESTTCILIFDGHHCCRCWELSAQICKIVLHFRKSLMLLLPFLYSTHVMWEQVVIYVHSWFW